MVTHTHTHKNPCTTTYKIWALANKFCGANDFYGDKDKFSGDKNKFGGYKKFYGQPKKSVVSNQYIWACLGTCIMFLGILNNYAGQIYNFWTLKKIKMGSKNISRVTKYFSGSIHMFMDYFPTWTAILLVLKCRSTIVESWWTLASPDNTDVSLLFSSTVVSMSLLDSSLDHLADHLQLNFPVNEMTSVMF